MGESQRMREREREILSKREATTGEARERWENDGDNKGWREEKR